MTFLAYLLELQLSMSELCQNHARHLPLVDADISFLSSPKIHVSWGQVAFPFSNLNQKVLITSFHCS